VLLASSAIGGALAPSLATALIQAVGWRWSFAAFGAVGAFWAAGFWWWFRDDPAAHPAVNPAELARIGGRAKASPVHEAIPWRAVAGNPSVRRLGLIMALASFNSYIYFSWYQKYLKSGRHVAESQAGLMASTVLALGAIGTLAGGIAVDGIVRRGGGQNGRRLLGGGAFLMAAVLLVGALRTNVPWIAASFTALSCLAAQSAQPLWWSCAIGISGRHVGALFGLMNMMGVVGAMSSQYLVGALADLMAARGFSGRPQWDPGFYIDVGVLVVAGLLWATFRFAPVEADRPEHAPET
jgi:predicted MFS family arabinose efflux permease